MCRHLYTWTHTEPNPVVDVQPVKFVLPELLQPSIVLAGVGDNPGRSIEDTLQLVFFGAPIKRLPQ